MSDATLPAPRSSSATPADEMGNPSDYSLPDGYFEASTENSYMSTAKEEASGDSGGGTDNKQKRKRTSPKDQAILEAEYKQNPKPNKAARADIVEKVDLNEKEVQIWFQNRRQINRRKSRPLLPHEIAAYGLGGMGALSSDPAPMFQFGSSHNIPEMPSSSQIEPVTQDHDDINSGQDEVEAVEPESTTDRPESSSSEKLSLLAENAISFLPSTLKRQESASSVVDLTSSNDDGVIKSFSSTPGYLSNRWNLNSSFSTPAASQIPIVKTPPPFTATQPTSCPERIDESIFTPSSSIRLSLSLDGKAELITSSPSPPRQHTPRPICSPRFVPPKRMRTLQRSQSAYSFARSPIAPSMPAFMPSLPAGRSMDARTWESCCDSEPRDALTMQAENESHGSAIAAISLLRSTSSSALKSNSNKRNAPTLKPESSKPSKKVKLSRAHSSLARLQSPAKGQEPTLPKDNLLRSPSGDSDKENWSPNVGGGNSRRRPLPSSRSGIQSTQRGILNENHAILSHASFGTNRGRKRKLASDVPKVFEDQDEAEVPEEIEQFMRGDISPSKKGDLDCVQGLLSLSQGAWR